MVALSLGTEVRSEINRGEFLLPVLQVRNEGAEPVAVSSRLNLFEGDLIVECMRPEDRTVRLAGVAGIDSFLRQTDVPAGRRLEAGIFLFYASEGFTFDETGSYRLRFEYHPGDGRDPVESDPSQVRVTEPSTDAARDLATLTTTGDLARTVALGGMDADEQTVEGLGELANRFPERREGVVARLVLATVAEELVSDEASLRNAFAARDPVTIARWITAITTPLDGRTADLTDAFRTYLDDEADEPAASRATRIVAGDPI